MAPVPAAAAPATDVVPARAGAMSCSSAGRSDDAAAEVHELLCLVNRWRSRQGLSELAESPRLDRSSRLRALAIRRCGRLSHTACAQSFGLVFAEAGYHGRSIGENLAWGGGSLGSPARTLAAWSGSPPHRRNLLGDWRVAGAALVHADRLFGASDVTVWVLQFGQP